MTVRVRTKDGNVTVRVRGGQGHGSYSKKDGDVAVRVKTIASPWPVVTGVTGLTAVRGLRGMTL